jgi:hypothetical protein
VQSWEVADAPARLALSVTSDDVGRIARQLDDGSFWLLTAVSPDVWERSPGAVDHGALTGLADDDHPQYLLASGSRALAGDLDAGGNDVVNVGLVDGRDVSADGTKLDGVEAGATGDQSAAEVPFTPAGNITSTDVQGALEELDAEKASAASLAGHTSDTGNPHGTDLGNLGAGTLADLNAAVTDATLDDAGDPRDPTAHASTHATGGGDDIAPDDIGAAFALLPPIIETGTARTLTAADNGRVILCPNVAGCTVTYDPDTQALPLGFACALVQRDASAAVTVAAGTGATVSPEAGHDPQTRGQNAYIFVHVIDVTTDAEVALVGGALAETP